MAVFGVFAQNEGKIPEKPQKNADFAEKVPLHARARKWLIYQHFPWCQRILKMCSLPCGTLRNMEKIALLPCILAYFWWVFDISWFLWYFRGRFRYLRLVPKWLRHVFCLNEISREECCIWFYNWWWWKFWPTSLWPHIVPEPKMSKSN